MRAVPLLRSAPVGLPPHERRAKEKVIHDLKGKVAIVTGASKGIGAAIARRLAEAGAAVVVNYASSKVEADRIVGNILRTGGKAVAIQADVSKSADVKRLFAQTVATLQEGPASLSTMPVSTALARWKR